ncbi:hypothetical protein CDAR_410671 [Caerostris darwini]|uniref:Uncharacterized protein n=1 Tax=Caerostris darwini TaxID=1538125 RepID=A0AAV4P4J2_9ARAC|nr:hypothetical protein CDAR_410671 [Caerostris darwini]
MISTAVAISRLLTDISPKLRQKYYGSWTSLRVGVLPLYTHSPRCQRTCLQFHLRVATSTLSKTDSFFCFPSSNNEHFPQLMPLLAVLSQLTRCSSYTTFFYDFPLQLMSSIIGD